MTTHGHGQKRLKFVGLWAGKKRRRKMREISGIWRRRRTQKIFGEGKLLSETEGWTEGRESKAQEKVLRDSIKKMEGVIENLHEKRTTS